MMKPKRHNQRLSSTYVPPKPRKTSVQKPLFEEEDEDTSKDLKIPENTQKDPVVPTVIQPEPEPEPIPESIIIEKQEDEKTVVDEATVEKSEPCQQCKKSISYRSDDRHPGIICQSCGHGQNNPNLKGVMY